MLIRQQISTYQDSYLKSSFFKDTEKFTASNTNMTINKNDDLILSPYYNNAVSLNVHIIISNNNILVFAPSVQINCEIDSKILYFGADFICYNQLSPEVKERLYKDAVKIGNYLRLKGYRGILGIDFLLYNNDLYFMEVNPRFQASTELINKQLSEERKKSLQELHVLAFENKPINIDTNFSVNYSNFAYSTKNISHFRLNKIINSSEIAEMQLDGYNIDNIISNKDNIYLCRCVFKRNIATIVNGKTLLHPNIFTENITPYLKSNTKYYKEFVKFALLNHGITLTNQANIYIKDKGMIKEAVFDAIDITIFKTIKVNVPFSCKFNSISPFTIDHSNGNLILLYDNSIITEVSIDLVPQSLIGMKTCSGVPYESIINLATDRIRINPAPVCIYKKNGTSCQFCNLPDQNISYDIEDIKEVVDYCLEYVKFRHFLIGGGTYSLNGGWNIIIQISEYIKSKCSKDIYLMAVPPKDGRILQSLKKSGITEVAFNLEIFDRDLAGKFMPGKGKIELNQYIAAFKNSVELWGYSGNVRTLLIYGFDTDEMFLEGIEKLCKLGVEPIISIFRPLANTMMENFNPPPTQDIFNLYKKCKEITEKYSLSLGPDCPDCQNNTLSFTDC